MGIFFKKLIFGMVFALGAVVPSVAEPVLEIASGHYPPYSIYDADGMASGLDVDVARIAAQRSGFELDFKRTAFLNVLQSLKHGRVDGALPLFRKPEREVYAAYGSVPLHYTSS